MRGTSAMGGVMIKFSVSNSSASASVLKLTSAQLTFRTPCTVSLRMRTVVARKQRYLY